jgi:hypothetical protein
MERMNLLFYWIKTVYFGLKSNNPAFYRFMIAVILKTGDKGVKTNSLMFDTFIAFFSYIYSSLAVLFWDT